MPNLSARAVGKAPIISAELRAADVEQQHNVNMYFPSGWDLYINLKAHCFHVLAAREGHPN